MSTSQKHADFIRFVKNMETLRVGHIAGIGDKAERLLAESDIIYAYQLLGLYLQCERNDDLFQYRLREYAGCINSTHSRDCVTCIKEWCEKYLEQLGW